MKKMFLNFSAVIFAAMIFSCAKPKTPADIARNAKVNFGYAVKIGDVLGENGDFTAENFSALVTENMFKWSDIHPTKKLWNFSDMNMVLDFAEENKMRVRGHTFIWHQGNPNYLSSEKNPEVLRALLEEQITTLMTQYKGRIYEYDVANEIFEEDGSFRKTFWYNAFGEEIYEYAFTLARKVDPKARLLLNDYNNENVGYAKSDAQYEFVKRLVEKGVPIDGIGCQLHLAEDGYFDKEKIRANIRRYADLGLKVSFTEVDIRIPLPPTEESVARQEQMFLDLMDLVLTEPNVDTYIFWGCTDRNSWVNSFFPGYGRPLPFDRDMNPKPAFTKMVEMMQNKK